VKIIEQININKTKIQELKTIINSIKKTLFEIIIEALTFKLINFTTKYNELINSYKEKQTNLNSNLKQLNQSLKNVVSNIEELEKLFEQEILLFKDKLTKFQKDLINLSKQRYINNYTQVKISEKLKNIIKNKEKFLLHKKVKNDILDLIELNNNPTKWIKKANKQFVKNEKIKEKAFFDTIESNPLTKTQQEAVLVNENKIMP